MRQWWRFSEKGLTPRINVPLRHTSPAKQEVIMYRSTLHAQAAFQNHQLLFQGTRIYSTLKMEYRPPTKTSRFIDTPTCHLRDSTALSSAIRPACALSNRFNIYNKFAQNFNFPETTAQHLPLPCLKATPYVVLLSRLVVEQLLLCVTENSLASKCEFYLSNRTFISNEL